MARMSGRVSVDSSILRWRAAAAVGVCGAVGAAVRFGAAGVLPAWITKYGGDAVWAMAWSLLALAVWPRLRRRAALAGLGVCTAIEVFQATGIPAAIAHHGFLVRLALGTTFGWLDLIAYAAGSAVAALIIFFMRADTGGTPSNAYRPR